MSSRLSIAGLAALIVTAGVLVYANAIDGPYLFDDFSAIVDNRSFQDLRSVGDFVIAPDETSLAGRPVPTLTFALTRAVGGSGIRADHIVNIAVHILCALVLFGIVRRTVALLPGRPGSSDTPAAFAAALVWLVHPLGTEPVNYIVQRTESLMALFYMLTLYCAIRAHDTRRRTAWLFAAVVFCACGMASKESMITCPAIVVLYDAAYRGPGLRVLRERWTFYTCLAGSWIVPAILIATGPRGSSVGFGLGVGPFGYLKNQVVVVSDYLRQVVWPRPLVFDYGYPLELPLSTVLPTALVLALLLALVITAAVRRPALGFPAMAFFLILAPTSTVVPIVTEVGATRRLYLPLAALVALAVVVFLRSISAGFGARGRRAGLLVVLAVAGALGWMTISRNEDYRTAERIWRSAIEATPQNPRAFNGLGRVLFRDGDIADARAAFERAIRIEPDYYHAQFNLGLALMELGHLEPAIAHFGRAAVLQPSFGEPHYRMASALSQLGATERAHAELLLAVRLDPRSPGAHNDLGNLLLDRGATDEAIRELRHAVELRADFGLAHYNLARALALRGDLETALVHSRIAVQLDPEHALAHSNLGTLEQTRGNVEAAMRSYRRALEIDVGTVEAWNNLGLALRSQGRNEEALRHFREAIRRDPAFDLARRNLVELEELLAAPGAPG